MSRLYLLAATLAALASASSAGDLKVEHEATYSLLIGEDPSLMVGRKPSLSTSHSGSKVYDGFTVRENLKFTIKAIYNGEEKVLYYLDSLAIL